MVRWRLTIAVALCGALVLAGAALAAGGRKANFKASGAFKVSVTNGICSPISSPTAHDVIITDSKNTKISLVVHDYRNGRVNLAKTKDDLVTVAQAIAATKFKVWGAGWEGALAPGPKPSPNGASIGSGTLVTSEGGTSGTLKATLKALPAKVDAGDVAKGTVKVSADWSC